MPAVKVPAHFPSSPSPPAFDTQLIHSLSSLLPKTKMYDTNHPSVRYDLFVCVTWSIHICDMTHWYVIWLIHICDMAHSCVTWLIHMCDMTHSYVWYDSFIHAHRVAAPVHHLPFPHLTSHPFSHPFYYPISFSSLPFPSSLLPFVSPRPPRLSSLSFSQASPWNIQFLHSGHFDLLEMRFHCAFKCKFLSLAFSNCWEVRIRSEI